MKKLIPLLLLLQLLLSSLEAPGTLASGTPASGAPLAPSSNRAPAPPTGAPVSAPEADQSPFLAVTWAGPEAHVGVPISLDIQATKGDHHTTLSTSGTVQLLLPDDRAEVSGYVGVQSTGGKRFALPLTAGSVKVAVTFHTPGQYQALAILAGSTPREAGQSATLRVG